MFLVILLTLVILFVTLYSINMCAAIAIVMPKITDRHQFEIRYFGLQEEIEQQGFQPVFAEQAASYDSSTHTFTNLFTIDNQAINPDGVNISVARDLTMATGESFIKPVYTDPFAPKLVHEPELNQYLLDKANLASDIPHIHPETIIATQEEIHEAVAAIKGVNTVVKPVTGMLGENIFIGKKTDIPDKFKEGRYLVQEFIDTSVGIETLGINEVHNIRMISINAIVIAAISRISSSDPHKLVDDEYGCVYLPEDLPESMLDIADAVHSTLVSKPGSGRNVIAIDAMRGKNPDGELVDVLCETNRRPLRIGNYDLEEGPVLDPSGILWLGSQWDKHEAKLLAEVATK